MNIYIYSFCTDQKIHTNVFKVTHKVPFLEKITVTIQVHCFDIPFH